jgi:hypothetical protein
VPQTKPAPEAKTAPKTDPEANVATLARIRALGCQNGIVLNPGTPASAIEPLLAHVDLYKALGGGWVDTAAARAPQPQTLP